MKMQTNTLDEDWQQLHRQDNSWCVSAVMITLGKKKMCLNSPIEMQGKGIRFASGHKFDDARELYHISQSVNLVRHSKYLHP